MSLETAPLPTDVRHTLLNGGFKARVDVLRRSPLELARELRVTPERALHIIKCVKGETDGAGQCISQLTHPKTAGGKSALELLQQKRAHAPIFTLCQDLDHMLGGGVPRGEITEFFGIPGIGKTQLSIQLVCDVQIPECFGGAAGEAVYIDTEGSFLPERAVQIGQGLVDHLKHHAADSGDETKLEALGAFTVWKLLRGIHVFRVHDHTEQLACVKALPRFLESHPTVRLVVMDSVAFHFRSDFDMDQMAQRTRLLIALAQDLLALASRFNLAVVLSNQVTTKIHEQESVLAPALGASWAHACTNRVALEWVRGGRVARLLKSPAKRVGCVAFLITQEGVRNAPRKRPREEGRLEPPAPV